MSETIPTVTDRRRYELNTLNRKDGGLAMLLGLFLGPLGYAYLRQWEWFVISALTLNYFLLGFVVVPVHIYHILNAAAEARDHE